MAFFTNKAVLLLLACFSQQLMSGSCHKAHDGRRGGRVVDRSAVKLGRQPKSVPAQPIKGKAVTRDKSECTWAVTGEDPFILGAICKKGGRFFSCDYVARPSLCPGYSANVDLYWKQIGRALKKQRTLCRDAAALVRAGVCRGADRDAHFRLHDARRTMAPPPTPHPLPLSSTGALPAATTVKSCLPANKKLAHEYCNQSWSSLCMFFFTMVRDYDC